MSRTAAFGKESKTLYRGGDIHLDRNNDWKLDAVRQSREYKLRIYSRADDAQGLSVVCLHRLKQFVLPTHSVCREGRAADYQFAGIAAIEFPHHFLVLVENGHRVNCNQPGTLARIET